MKRKVRSLWLLTLVALSVVVVASSLANQKYQILIYKDPGYQGDWPQQSADCPFTIVVTNPNAETLYAYQVKVDLPAELIGQDIIITSQQGDQVPYCYEQANGECSTTKSGTIWFKAGQLGGLADTLYCVNIGTDGSSGGDHVFDFYDDFSAAELDASRWNVRCSYTLEDGWLKISNAANENVIESQSTFGAGYATKLRMHGGAYQNGSDQYCGNSAKVSGEQVNFMYSGCCLKAAGLHVYQTIGDTCSAPSYTAGPLGNTYTVAWRMLTGSSSVEVNGSSYAVSGTPQQAPISLKRQKNADVFHIDYVIVRKLALQEPVASVQAND